MIRIVPKIKRSLPWFTSYSFIKFYWNPSITFSAIRLAILNIRIQNPDSDPHPAEKVTKSCRSPELSTHKMSLKSVLNLLLRYPAKILKSGVNLDPGSGLWSGSSSKPNQFVRAPAAIDPLNFIEICP